MSDETSALLLTALPTPFDERGRIDDPAMARLVEYFADRSGGGLAVLTEAGEGLFLDATERRAIVERTAEGARDKVPFWVEISDFWTRSAIDAARHAEEAGAEGLLLSMQRLPGVGYPEVYRHVDRVVKATSCRIVLVVRPGDIVWALAAEEQATLAEHPRLSGVFLAERGGASHRAWSKRFEGRGEVLGACSFETTDETGGGALCALSVLAPEPARVMMEARAGGDAEAIRRIYRRMKPLLERLGPPKSTESQGRIERLAERIARRPLDGGRLPPWAPVALIKEGLRLQGHRLKGFVRPPQPQVTREERDKLKVLLKTCGMLG